VTIIIVISVSVCPSAWNRKIFRTKFQIRL